MLALDQLSVDELIHILQTTDDQETIRLSSEYLLQHLKDKSVQDLLKYHLLLAECMKSTNATLNQFCHDLLDRTDPQLIKRPWTTHFLESALDSVKFTPILLRNAKDYNLFVQFVQAEHDILSQPPRSKHRIYELLAGLCSLSEQHFEFLHQNGLLDFASVNVNDPLECLNQLEILGSLSQAEHGLMILQRLALPQLNGLLSEPVDRIISSGLYKFYGHLLYHQHQHLESLPCSLILDSFAKGLETNPSSVMVALANVAGSIPGLVLLHDHPILDQIIEISKYAAGDLRVTCYVTLVHLFNHKESSSQFLQQVCSGAQSQTEELQYACLAILKTIVRFDFGMELAQQDTLAHFLLERHESREIQMIKYDICKIIHAHPQSNIILGKRYFDYERVVRLGPFATDAGPLVSTQTGQ
ncbi:hypothetical protein EDD86DRAFT_246616 [Gorgonomyces haynaldii]|nr:hypothetical protein EDD86DRAFT_246616 [Gorgonomyces haynaldii]